MAEIDYEKILKEALNNKSLPFEVTSWIEEQFPQLAESKDERICRKLIAFLKQCKAVYGDGFKQFELDIDDALAWLEKQGEHEQKLTLPKWKYKKDYTPLLRDSLILNKYGCVAKSPSGAIVSDVWVIDYDELAKLPKEEFEKQGKQKPAEWSEEDEEMRRKCICAMRASACGFPEEEKFVEQVDNWLKSLKDRFTWKPSGEQKPLFPDNEVRDIWEYIAQFKTLYGHYPNNADEIEVIVREMIKSKSEWNKRDEEILDTIISVFTHRYADDSEDERDISSLEIVRWAEKLKSRRLKSEWKPSEEQMEALESAAANCAYSEYQDCLRELIGQLRKLREE